MIRRQHQSLFIKDASPAPERKPGLLKRVLGFFGRMARRLSLLLGGLMLITMMVSCAAGFVTAVNQPALPDQIILTLRLDKGLREFAPQDELLEALSISGTQNISTQEIVDAIDRASRDDRVSAIKFSIEAGNYDLSHVRDIRAAIERFRAAGKKTYAYSPSYAEAGSGMGAYYLASAFEEIWMQPMGMVNLSGFDAQAPFFAGALKKIGVTPHFYQRKQYKSAMENITRESMSEPNREMMTSLLGDILNRVLADIARDRGLDAAKLRDRGLLLDQEAKQAGLVTHLEPESHMLPAMIDAVRKGEAKVAPESLVRYATRTAQHQSSPGKTSNRPMVGIVYLDGAIVSHEDGMAYDMSGSSAAADRVAPAITRAATDRRIGAIVLRVNSPGGSPTASETIRNAILFAIERGKPVIVSMGSMAGSGGYWITVNASHIFANPYTLTGSIGVVAGKVDIAGLLDKAGIHWDGVVMGRNADMWSVARPFSPDGDARMNAITDSIYAGFIQRVAEGRKLTPDQVDKIAMGRVWTGGQALEIGLVDQMGGLDSALDYAARAVGARDRFAVNVRHLPRAKSPFERLSSLMRVETIMDNVIAAITLRIEQAATPRAQVYDPALLRGARF